MLSVFEEFHLVFRGATFGHSVWLSASEFDRIFEHGASIAFCPASNLFLGSGFFQLGEATRPDKMVYLLLLLVG